MSMAFDVLDFGHVGDQAIENILKFNLEAAGEMIEVSASADRW